jgi:hypothetical protein
LAEWFILDESVVYVIPYFISGQRKPANAAEQIKMFRKPIVISAPTCARFVSRHTLERTKLVMRLL